MAPVKRASSINSSSKLNFRPNRTNNEAQNTEVRGLGSKPLPEPATIKNVLLMMFQHICRKILFINTYYRVAVYLAGTFLISVVTDFVPAAKLPLTRKESFLNMYFVKVGWGWTLLFAVPFVVLTSNVYCCGDRKKIVGHLSRLLIATGFWLFWTNAFNYIENIYGRCNIRDRRLQSRSSCLGKGHFWQSIDISGHCFILIYSTLVLIEEARVINSWEGITDLIRDEQHSRMVEDTEPRTNPLRNLALENFEEMRCSYLQYTPYIRSLFITITFLTLLWDAMLLSTVIFYHNMLEKLIETMVAVFTWYVTYYIWYPNWPPNLPGDGDFKYRDLIKPQASTKKRANRQTGPIFMGMPLKVPDEKSNSQQKNVSDDSAPKGKEEVVRSKGSSSGGNPATKGQRPDQVQQYQRPERVRKQPDWYQSEASFA